MKRTRCKLWSLLLAAALCLAAFPTGVFAAGGDGQDSGALVLGTGGISGPKENTDNQGKYYTPNSYVYFGVNGGDPIKWRVLDADKANDGTTDGMFLLSEYLLDSIVFKDLEGELKSRPNSWKNSDAQKWCQEFADSSNFSLAEQEAMLSLTKNDAKTEWDYSPYGPDDVVPFNKSSLTEKDKMFFLSIQELMDHVADYDCAPELIAKDTGDTADMWWLRSGHEYNNSSAGHVIQTGEVGTVRVNEVRRARPAFNLDRNSVLFTSAAEGGKPAGEGLQAIPADSGSEWKLTLKDGSRNFGASLASQGGNLQAGEKISITYTGAKTGANESVSAILADSAGKALYYGRIAQGSEAGTAEVIIPAGLADGSYTLKVFSEQANGDYRTDYASDFVDLDITVGQGGDPGPDNPSGEDKPSRPSGGGDDDGYDHDDANYDFWQEVKSKIEEAESGDTIKVNAKSYDEMSFTVMEALYENSGVSLEIRWNGGETFTIPAGKALAPEKGRIFYRLDYLAELYSGEQAPEQAPAPEADPSKENPNTGAGSWWDYLVFLFHALFDRA